MPINEISGFTYAGERSNWLPKLGLPRNLEELGVTEVLKPLSKH